jgi:hypothetical protein
MTTGATVRTGATGGTTAVFIAGGDTTDQLYQHWWWYRVEGQNAREFAFSNRTSNTAAGNVLTLEYAEPEGLRARIVYTLTDGPDVPASANVAIAVTVSNVSGAPMRLALFDYLDYDLEGAATDSAVALEPGRVQIVDSTTGFMGQFLGVNPDTYWVATFATVRTGLTNAGIDNCGNTGLPFAAADFTGALQWNMTLAPGESRTIRAALSLNMTADAGGGPPPCDPDYNQDGNVDQDDVAYLVNVIAGGANPTGRDPDFNRDGNVDQDDYRALVDVIAGGPCP